MYVYADIVKLFPVSNSQIPIMDLFQIKSKFQEMGNWELNLPLYVRVWEINITTITIKIFAKTG